MALMCHGDARERRAGPSWVFGLDATKNEREVQLTKKTAPQTSTINQSIQC